MVQKHFYCVRALRFENKTLPLHQVFLVVNLVLVFKPWVM